MLSSPGARKFLCIALPMAVLCGLARGESPIPHDAVVAQIEGTALTAPELGLFIAWRKADVAARLFPGEPALSALAWERRIEGRSAAATLKAAALADAIEARLLLALAVEHGLLADSSWPAFERALADENARRAAVVAAGKPIYGPRAFGAAQFYRKRLHDLRQALARKFTDAAGGTSTARVAEIVAARRARVRLEIDGPKLESLPIE